MINSILKGSPYQHYVYSYPHKTAYREIAPAIPLHQLWQKEDISSLFLYLHVPFCEFRCGFCNLFTRAIPPPEMPALYLKQLEHEVATVRAELGQAQFAQMAIGGGTPTFLNDSELEQLFAIVGKMGVDPAQSACGIECSPGTVTPAKLRLLADLGVQRISVGVQSFSKRVSKTLGRPQDLKATKAALDLLRHSRIERLNIDLIYGAAGQTVADFVDSIDELLTWKPEEVFLYPLYIRPLTGLGKSQNHKANDIWDAQRLDCYRAGRERLLHAGYQQQSMRMFTREVESIVPSYCCQSDGMVGIGCGARSYTRDVHYSTEYAVGRNAVHAILDSYIARDPSQFAKARFGYKLSLDEQMRRFTLMSLLQASGLQQDGFQSRFGVRAVDALPELQNLLEQEFALADGGTIRLTECGMERSDQIGPMLFSSEVHSRMEAYSCV